MKFHRRKNGLNNDGKYFITHGYCEEMSALIIHTKILNKMYYRRGINYKHPYPNLYRKKSLKNG